MWWALPEHRGELERTLTLINSMDRAAWPDAVLDALFDCPATRLAAYGTLRPGESNHGMLAALGGAWTDGTVQGVRFMANGYPAFTFAGAEPVPVSVLTSAALPADWPRLDAFEGREYRRILAPVRQVDGTSVVAYLYEYLGGSPGSA
ncbi:MAG TPA: gamma-glutamylcyclotransferase family protein [Chloroflexota bacterium]|nr:gamma-glutamylcyclotransferase family protein [Chloroflexota bacterium]